METTHSKTSRAKSPATKIVIPSWESVWESFKTETEKTSIEEMNSDGWKTLQQVADEYGRSRPHINQMANIGKFESVRKNVYHAGKTRQLVFIRPKIAEAK